ncbi:MAG TPA: hypothetical protein VEI96_10985 [Thermodesulfovibrionales bacterium]|nr:hypothetical protein [Thermodesulfovibrionales bacterium]
MAYVLLVIHVMLLAGCAKGSMEWHIGDVMHMGWLAILLALVLLFALWHLVRHIVRYLRGKEK